MKPPLNLLDKSDNQVAQNVAVTSLRATQMASIHKQVLPYSLRSLQGLPSLQRYYYDLLLNKSSVALAILDEDLSIASFIIVEPEPTLVNASQPRPPSTSFSIRPVLETLCAFLSSPVTFLGVLLTRLLCDITVRSIECDPYKDNQSTQKRCYIVSSIAVRQDYCRSGHGSYLFKYAIKELRKRHDQFSLSATTTTLQPNAVRFYCKQSTLKLSRIKTGIFQSQLTFLHVSS